MRHAQNTLKAGLALVASLALASCSADSTPSTAPPSSSPSPTQTDGPTDMRGYEGPLEPGTYSIPQWGDETTRTRALVDVPAGYYSPGGWVVDPGHGTLEPDQFGDLAFYRADKVVTDPCRGAPAEEIADTPQALADALSNQPTLRTSTPEPVTVGGYPGLHLKGRVAKGVDLTACISDRLSLWMYGDEFYGLERTDVVLHLWILDVNDERIIMGLRLYPNQPPGQDAEMLTMARGVRFTDPPEK